MSLDLELHTQNNLFKLLLSESVIDLDFPFSNVLFLTGLMNDESKVYFSVLVLKLWQHFLSTT